MEGLTYMIKFIAIIVWDTLAFFMLYLVTYGLAVAYLEAPSSINVAWIGVAVGVSTCLKADLCKWYEE